MRVLVLMTLAYVAGVLLGRLWLVEPYQAWWAAGMLGLVLLAASFRRLLAPFLAVLLVVMAAAGGLFFVFASRPVAGGILDYAGSRVRLEGTVEAEPLVYQDHVAYRVKVEQVETPEGRFPSAGRLLVKVYGEEQEPYWFGERLRLQGEIVVPRGRRNPGGFDYRLYLRTQGIDALMNLKPYQVASAGPGETRWFGSALVKLRSSLAAGILEQLPSPAAELLVAILFGQRHRLPDPVQENFKMAGAGHIMAVSGLHVGLVAGLFLSLGRRLARHSRLFPALAIGVAVGYALLTGGSPSALRAAIMAALGLAALLLDRERDLPTAMALAALITLVLNPAALFNTGFQLSYAATLAVIYLYQPLNAFLRARRLPPFIADLLSVTAAAQAGVLPLSAYHVQHIPLGALFFNLLLLPVMGLVVGPGLGAALLHLVLPALAVPLFWACRALLEYLLVLTSLADPLAFYRPVYPPGTAALVLLYGGAAAALALYYNRPRLSSWIALCRAKLAACRRWLPRGRMPLLIPALLLALLLTWWPLLFPASPVLTVTFLDVGQGAAALIETPGGGKILVDAGGEQWGEIGSVGRELLLPFLRHRGIRSLDLVIVSHPHEDHFTGLFPLLETIPVRQMLISPVAGDSALYQELLSAARRRGAALVEARAGQRWSCSGGTRLEILGPPEALVQEAVDNLNDASIVLRLVYRQAAFLFCGDIEDQGVQELLRHRGDLSASVLLVPHHGSRLEALSDLLSQVKPRAAVISVGGNPFGHPAPATLETLEQAGVECWRTDRHGAVVVRTDGGSISIRPTERSPT
ncbi:MAG: DNA internalization-related competence protein ComEC/Rec2 [Dethiobacteria bacterium]